MKIRNEIQTIVKDRTREDVETVVIESVPHNRHVRLTVAKHSVLLSAEEVMQAVDNCTRNGRVL